MAARESSVDPLLAARTEALFVSSLSPSDPRLHCAESPKLAIEVLETTVRETLRVSGGSRACALTMAALCGDDLSKDGVAAKRLAWAHAMATLLGPATHSAVLVPA